MSVPELACSYACIVLHDDGIPVTVRLQSLSASLTSADRLIWLVEICFCCPFNLGEMTEMAGGEDRYGG